MKTIRKMVALLVLCIATALSAQQKPLDAAQLQLALRKLNVLGSALYVAAHPDDENTALIAYFSNERLLRTGYLSMNRGDGGQNLLGDEKGELLGLIRTQELLAARRIDGGEQFFTRAVDFGYSKNPEESMAIWGHDTILADVVWTIRRFQPDVIVTRFPTTGEGGHGHHTASAILAVEAFKAAGDATKFPEQLKYVAPWQPRRLYWNRFQFGPQTIKPDDPSVAKSLHLDLGTFNPLLGRAYSEIAGEGRSMHKSQGFGAAERRGSILNYFDLLDGPPAKTDLFEGIDQSWSRYPGGEAVGKILQQASDTFDAKAPAKTLPLLLQAWELMDRLGARPEWAPNLNPWIDVKRRELAEAIRGCAGIAIDVSAGDSAVVPGGEIPVSVTVLNRSDYPFVLQTVGSRYANPSKGVGKKLENNQPIKVDLTLKVPDDFATSQPYWLRKPATKGTYVVDDQRLIGLAENPPSIPLVVSLDDNMMHTILFTVPAVFRRTDAVLGERVRNLDVVPEVTANLGANVYVFPEAQPKNVTVGLKNFGAADPVNVRLLVPSDWKVDPASVPVTFAAKGEEKSLTFTVTPPKGETTGTITAEVELKSRKKLHESITSIDYPHIPAQRVFDEASSKLVRLDVKKRGTHIGYVMGSGDEIPEALRQVGYDVTLLTDADLERGDFGKYDAIVTGVRAYNTRQTLKTTNAKLLDYVKAGGTLVAQYSSTSPQPMLIPAPGPYPFEVSRDRVTVEEAPVTLLKPDHPLFNVPNKIVPKDFDGWVQERGLYYTQNWDPRYETVMATNDPGEESKPGGELFAHVGKGVYIYTSYAWFRQLPAGVPGAYKLFVNLVSAR